MLTALALVIETLVVRHYGLETVFITPLAILLIEAGQGSAMAPQQPLADPPDGCRVYLGI